MFFELIGPAGCGKTTTARVVDRRLAALGVPHLPMAELHAADRAFGEKRITRRRFFGKTWMLLPMIARHPTVVASMFLLAFAHGQPYKRRIRQANRALAHLSMGKRLARRTRREAVVLHEGFVQMVWSTTVESERLRLRFLVRYLLWRYRRILRPRGILFRIDDDEAQERVFQREGGNRFSAGSSDRRRREFPRWLDYHRQLLELAPRDLIVATVDATRPLDRLAEDVLGAIRRCLSP